MYDHMEGVVGRVKHEKWVGKACCLMGTEGNSSMQVRGRAGFRVEALPGFQHSWRKTTSGVNWYVG